MFKSNRSTKGFAASLLDEQTSTPIHSPQADLAHVLGIMASGSPTLVEMSILRFTTSKEKNV